jgi:hypothetical protein
MNLSEYTDKQIKQEYRRRLRLKNSEWYFIPYYDDPDPEWRSDIPEFAIVNKRTWHLTKSIAGEISSCVKLPPKFKETTASHVRYDKYGLVTKLSPEQLLEKYNFVRLDTSLDLSEYKTTQAFNSGLKANWICDTPELKAIARKWIDDEPNSYGFGSRHDVAFSEFLYRSKDMAEKHGCVIYSYNYKPNKIINVAFLKKEVFDNLPPPSSLGAP